MASTTFLINDTSTGGNVPVVEVTITENDDGTLRFTLVQLVAAGAYLGDLRGLFFDLVNESLLGSLSVSDASKTLASGAVVAVTQPVWTSGDDSVNRVGHSDTNMNGLLGSDGGYDFGIEIGSQGIGKKGDDVRAFSFTLDSSARDLTLADFANVDFGVRITSVGQDVDGNGTIDTSRSGSAKIGETGSVILQLPDGGASQSYTFGGPGSEFDEVIGGNGVDTLTVIYGGTQTVQITSDGQTTDGHLLIDFDNDGSTDLTVTAVEELVVNAQHVTVSGDLSHTGLASETIFYEGTPGNDNFDASGEVSNIAIVANGYAGNDTLITAGGNDTLIGGEGNDTLNGGGGRDRASYADATGAISVDMAGGTVTGPDVGTDTLVSIEFVQGSASADTYVATGYAGNDNLGSLPTTNAFEGMGGDDTITGNGSTILQYFNATAGVTVEFTDGTAGTAYSTESGDAAGVGTDTFTGVVGARGSAFDDRLLGSDANQQFFGGDGEDFIDGGGGFDRVVYAPQFFEGIVSGGVNVQLAAGIVTGDVSVDTDTLRSIEVIRGTDFADVYNATGFGQVGAVNVGSNGTSNEFEGMAGNDMITGNGNTVIGFGFATAGVTVNLAEGTATGNASVGNDTFTGVNHVTGSSFDDSIIGNANPNSFAGAGGNDTIDGGANPQGLGDIVGYGSSPSGVTVNLETGVANDGFGTVDTLTNIEVVNGSRFADALTGSSLGNELFEGGGGDDLIDGGGNVGSGFGDFVQYGGFATSGISVNLSLGTASDGLGGTDTLVNIESVNASRFNDTVIGDANRNLLRGFGGNDTIYGGDGNDQLEGDPLSNPTLTGDDVLFGEGGNDQIFGNAGNDSIDGGAGNDTLVGGNGSNFLEGGAGDDTIDGGADVGGEDPDVASYSSSPSEVTVDLGTGVANDGFGTVDALVNIENVSGSSFSDRLTGNADGNVMAGLDGSDTIYGGDGNDQLVGGGGDDWLEGGAGNDTIDGGADDGLAPSDGLLADVADYRGSLSGVTVDLGTGVANDGFGAVDALVNIETVFGSEYADTLTGNADGNVLAGFDGSDTIYGGDGNDLLVGDAGDDFLFGEAGDDLIVAGEGSDRINGGAGNDSLSGEDGVHTFVFASGFGQDIITNFTAGSGAGHDVIEFDQTIFADFDAVQNAAADVDDNVVITAGTDTVTLVGITTASLTVDNFLFV